MTTAIIVIVLLILAAVAVVVWMRAQQAKRREGLQDRFGPEYDRAVDEHGDRKAAEKQLADTASRRDSIEVRPLEPAERERYGAEWTRVQADFVDSPTAATREADRLVQSVMRDRGYPVDDFDTRSQMLAADHPEVVEHYRAAHAVGSRQDPVDTEDAAPGVRALPGAVRAAPRRRRRPPDGTDRTAGRCRPHRAACDGRPPRRARCRPTAPTRCRPTAPTRCRPTAPSRPTGRSRRPTRPAATASTCARSSRAVRPDHGDGATTRPHTLTGCRARSPHGARSAAGRRVRPRHDPDRLPAGDRGRARRALGRDRRAHRQRSRRQPARAAAGRGARLLVPGRRRWRRWPTGSARCTPTWRSRRPRCWPARARPSTPCTGTAAGSSW